MLSVRSISNDPKKALTLLLKSSHTICSVGLFPDAGTYMLSTTPKPLSIPWLTPTSLFTSSKYAPMLHRIAWSSGELNLISKLKSSWFLTWYWVPSHLVGVYGPSNRPLGTDGSAVAMYWGEGSENPWPAETISFKESKQDWSPKKKPNAPLVPSAPNEFSISLYKVQAVILAQPRSLSILNENSKDSWSLVCGKLLTNSKLWSFTSS